MTAPIRDDPDFMALLRLSAELGRNPLRTQAAGGNTSLKRDGIMWIKASGTWLADAEDRDVMVPVALDALMKALATGDRRAETATDFVAAELNPSGLRPSVERLSTPSFRRRSWSTSMTSPRLRWRCGRTRRL